MLPFFSRCLCGLEVGEMTPQGFATVVIFSELGFAVSVQFVIF